jgi:hypothetical protein
MYVSVDHQCTKLGPMLRFLKIVQKWLFLTQNSAKFFKKNGSYPLFLKKKNSIIFSRKSEKISEKCSHNIDLLAAAPLL